MDVEETAVCLVSKNKSSEETDCEIEITSQSHTKPIKNEIRESDFSDEESKSVRLNKLFDEYLTKSSCQNDQNPDEEVIKSSSSSENRKTISETEVNSDRRIVLRKREDDLKVSMYDLDEINDENKQVELKVHDVNQERAAMYAVYQPWVIRTYGDFTKTKTVSLKKYDRIVKTLLGLIPNCAENSKFRFWIRSKGFRLGLPSSIALVSDPNQLYVLGRKSGIEGRSFRKVAVVEQFFEIIHQVHVESGGKHAGQKKTYRTITQTYAFLPREAVTKFLLGCFECQKRLVLDGQGSDILNYSSNKRTPIKRALKRKHNTWEPSPSPMIVDFATHSINLSVPLENKKQKFLKFHDDLNDPCLADDEEKSSDGYNPRVSWRRNFDTYLAPKIRSSNRDTFKPIKLQRNYDINRESGPTNLRPLIDEESVDYRDEVLDLQCKSSSTYSSKKSHIKNECAYREKEDSTDSESVYKRETCPLDPRLEICNPIYNTTSECYFKHQIERDDFKRDYSLMVNVPNVLRPDPVLILKSSEERDLEKDKICRKLEVRPRIRDLDREQNSKKYLLNQLSSKRSRPLFKRYTSTPEPPTRDLIDRNDWDKCKYRQNRYSRTSTSTNENDSAENELLDLSPINRQNKISKFKLPQSVEPVSYIQIPVWNPDLFKYRSESCAMESYMASSYQYLADNDEEGPNKGLLVNENSDSDQLQNGDCARKNGQVCNYNEAMKNTEENIMTTEMESGDDDHFSARNGELRLSSDLPPDEMGGGGMWPTYPVGLKKSTSTPPGSRDLSSPVILQETGSVHDETSSSGNKEDEDDDEEDVDDLKTLPHDPERLKAFNMFVRLFVDENLDRIVPISKQPKEKIQAIIDSCTRQFPEFAERARKRIRTYLKSCRRNKRARDPGNWPEANRPTPAHLTSVQAEQILAQACENESHNAKRMRLGLEPVSQPMPVLPGQSDQPRPIDHFSSSSLTTTTTSSLNNNSTTSGSNTSISQSDSMATETNKEPAGGSGKTVLQQHLNNNNNNNIANNNNIKEVLNCTKGSTATSSSNDHSLSKITNSRSSLSSSSALNGSPVVSRIDASPFFRPNPAFSSQAFTPARGVSSQTSIYSSTSPNVFSASPFGPAAGMMGNGPTDLSMKQASKPLLNHKLSPAEMAAVRQLITGYRESAAFLLRSADELEQLLLQQP